MYSVCIAPYPPGYQPVTKTLCKSPTGPALQHFAADFLRFTILLQNTQTSYEYV